MQQSKAVVAEAADVWVVWVGEGGETEEGGTRDVRCRIIVVTAAAGMGTSSNSHETAAWPAHVAHVVRSRLQSPQARADDEPPHAIVAALVARRCDAGFRHHRQGCRHHCTHCDVRGE